MAGDGRPLLLVLLAAQLYRVLSDPADCLENEFEDERGDCVPCRECGPGQELSKECGYGEGGDAKCVACGSRRYKKNWGHHRCIPCLSCDLINRSQKSNCTPRADADCGDCLLGFYSKTRIGGLKEQECIPCTPLTPPAETQCNYKAVPIKLEGSAPPPQDVTALLIGGSIALAMIALALVILSVYCRRFFHNRCQHAFLISPKLLGPKATLASCESQSNHGCAREQPHTSCGSGANIAKCNQQTQGPVEQEPYASESSTSSLQSRSLPCAPQSAMEHCPSSQPGNASQFMRRISERQPLIRHSDSSDCSTGCLSSEARQRSLSAIETVLHHPMSATLSCASEQCQHRWSHAPVECTELELHRYSMEPECLGAIDPLGPVTQESPEMTEGITGASEQPQEPSDPGFQHFSIENGVNEFQSLVTRISNLTQGLRLGKIPPALVLLLSLRLDPCFPGVKNYMDVGTELGVPSDLMSQMSGYGHLHAYLSASSLCTIPSLMQALHRVQRFDALSLLCDHFVQDQEQRDQHPH
ncbi:tumor necrosis factor receptor superfamily member 27 [Ambystoma mexicanum]|uniref:tumor necrosis factor receptor superfamily member 27 n=1 Tax=Ambystoma mexicanum TaxID=8296 RepID=UPI0037E96745